MVRGEWSSGQRLPDRAATTFVGPEPLTAAQVTATGEHVRDVGGRVAAFDWVATFGEVAELGDLTPGDRCGSWCVPMARRVRWRSPSMCGLAAGAFDGCSWTFRAMVDYEHRVLDPLACDDVPTVAVYARLLHAARATEPLPRSDPADRPQRPGPTAVPADGGFPAADPESPGSRADHGRSTPSGTPAADDRPHHG